MALVQGTRLGFYEVIRPLGSGGMGEVYLARDSRLDREVAIKIITPSLASDPDRLARFVREAKTASSVNHPNIAHVYEIGVADEVHFIAMEYIRGEDLRTRIGSRGMPIADVLTYAAQIADALDEAHAHGIVHRDLKPANTLVNSRGQVKILDFLLNLQLIDVARMRQEWGKQYKLRLSEIDLAQENIAAEVAETLNLRFDAGQRRAQEVYRLYQRGRFHLSKRRESDLQQAIELFELAIEKDRTYTRAWAGLAQAHNLLHIYGVVKPAVAAPAAKAAAERALALDAGLADAHTQRALVAFRWEWDWAAAERMFARAVVLDDSNVDARHWGAMFFAATGRFDDAARLVREAQRIDPLDAVAASDLGWTWYMGRRYDEAIAESQRAADLRPESFHPHWYMGLALSQQRAFDKAVKALETAVELSGGQSTLRAELASILAAAGRRSEARRVRDELVQAGKGKGFVSAYQMALVAVALGESGRAVEWLEMAAREREGLLVWAHQEPRLDALREHPHFARILSAMALR
ncbi:MAG: protein kinase domain-containing protein [Acidobacteriota bacterium]